MKRLALAVLAPLLLSAAPESSPAKAPASDHGVLGAMRDELARSMRDLKLPGAEGPYFLGYWVVDSEERSIEATLGVVLSDQTSRSRFGKVDLRVGSPRLDNSSFSGDVPADEMLDLTAFSPRLLTTDEDPLAIRRDLWLETDAAYKNAVASLEKKKAAQRAEMMEDDEPPSFSADVSSKIVAPEPPAREDFDPRRLAKNVSAVFRSFPDVQKSDVHLLSTSTRKRHVASDGGEAVESQGFAGIEISAETQAEDGMTMARSAFVAAAPGKALSEDRAAAEARRIADELVRLRTAPLSDDYTGPVLFEGRAAPQLVYELLGDALSGTPPPGGADDLEGPLTRRVGKRILPKGVTVVDDPTLGEFAGQPLLGHYAIDDEGIAAERVSLVEDGHLRAFLMSRTPRDGFARSNGHGRSGLIGWARGRPANLLMTAKGGLSKAALRARLLAAVRDEGAEYGIVVTELEPRVTASSGSVMPPPELVHRVYPDGRETPVRGATIASIPLRALRGILATGREPHVYGFLAESDGGLDTGVSVVAPSLLLDDVELRAPTGPNKRPPRVPRPPLAPLSAQGTGGRAGATSLQQRTPSE